MQDLNKQDYWDPTYEDAINLLAKLPEIAACIYPKFTRSGKREFSDPNLDMGANFAQMMGIGKPYDDVSRMHFILHSDHESGNVSAHTGHLVASSLSDIYLSISSMINGWPVRCMDLPTRKYCVGCMRSWKKWADKIPTEEEMKQFVWDTLNIRTGNSGFRTCRIADNRSAVYDSA